MTFAFLKFLLTKFITSKSVLIQFEGKDHLIDNNTEALILKINHKKFLIKLFYAPSLVLTEGYMDKDYELPNQYADFKKVRDKKYGDSRLSIFKLGEKTDD